MVQPGQDWDGDNDTGPLDRPAQRRILAQRQVRARLIVVRRIRSKNSPQVRLAKDQHSIQALAAHGADQAFRIAILPGRSRRDRSVADSRLIVSYFVGGRDGEYAMAFMDDLTSRLSNRVQLTTDGHRAYAVEGAFGMDVDYAMLVKLYGDSPEAEKRYSPAVCIGCRSARIMGKPDPAHVSTSYAERQNLNMRMQMRRFTRLTTGYSKKIENHTHMVALYTVWYNWIRTHKAHRVTPAMAAGLTDKLMDMADVARLIDDAEMRATIQQRAALLALPQSN